MVGSTRIQRRLSGTYKSPGPLVLRGDPEKGLPPFADKPGVHFLSDRTGTSQDSDDVIVLD